MAHNDLRIISPGSTYIQGQGQTHTEHDLSPLSTIGRSFDGTQPNSGHPGQAAPQTSPIQPPSYTPSVSYQRPAWSKFSIQTKTDALSSGFPYDERLENLNLVSHEDWFQFEKEIVNACKITPSEDWVAWTTGLTTGTLTSPFLLVFAPWVGYYAGRRYHRKAIETKVQEKLTGDGDVRSILTRWNSKFAERSFHTWLALPDDPKEVRADGTKSKKRRFRILIIPGIELAITTLQPTQNPNERSITGVTHVEAVGTHAPTLDELPSNLHTHIAPARVFPSDSMSKTAAYTTSPLGRGSERPGTTQSANPGEIKHEIPPNGMIRQELPGEREMAELA